MWTYIKRFLKMITICWVMLLITFATYMTFDNLEHVNGAVATSLGTVVGIFSIVVKILFDKTENEDSSDNNDDMGE